RIAPRCTTRRSRLDRMSPCLPFAPGTEPWHAVQFLRVHLLLSAARPDRILCTWRAQPRLGLAVAHNRVAVVLRVVATGQCPADRAVDPHQSRTGASAATIPSGEARCRA